MTPLAKQMLRKKLKDRALAGIAGVDHTVVYRLRMGQAEARVQTWQRLGAALGVDYRRLLPEPSEGVGKR